MLDKRTYQHDGHRYDEGPRIESLHRHGCLLRRLYVDLDEDCEPDMRLFGSSASVSALRASNVAMPSTAPMPLFALLSILAWTACLPVAARPSAPPTSPAESWSTHVEQTHPLVGMIFDSATLQPMDRAAVLKRVSSTHFVLLGEKHDNADHHRLQATIVQAMIDAGRRPTIGFEMLEAGAQQVVNQIRLTDPDQPDPIATAVDWDSSGWPEWAIYRPVFAAASHAYLPILATNVSNVQVRLIVRYGAGAFMPGQMQLWGLDRPLPDDQSRELREELRNSHCGMLPERIVEAMILAQRARDAGMAARMIDADSAQGVVLIAGGGHVRRDRGVPLYLAARRPHRSVVSIAWVEVQSGSTNPRDYDSGADLVWFTPRVDNDDPCAKFGK